MKLHRLMHRIETYLVKEDNRYLTQRFFVMSDPTFMERKRPLPAHCASLSSYLNAISRNTSAISTLRENTDANCADKVLPTRVFSQTTLTRTLVSKVTSAIAASHTRTCLGFVDTKRNVRNPRMRRRRK